MNAGNIVVGTIAVGFAALLEGCIGGTVINPGLALASALYPNVNYDDPAFDQSMIGNAILGAISTSAFALQGQESTLAKLSLFNLTAKSVTSPDPLTYGFLIGARYALGAALGNFIDRLSGGAISSSGQRERKSLAEQNNALTDGMLTSLVIMTVLSGLVNLTLNHWANPSVTAPRL